MLNAQLPVECLWDWTLCSHPARARRGPRRRRGCGHDYRCRPVAAQPGGARAERRRSAYRKAPREGTCIFQRADARDDALACRLLPPHARNLDDTRHGMIVKVDLSQASPASTSNGIQGTIPNANFAICRALVTGCRNPVLGHIVVPSMHRRSVASCRPDRVPS